MSRELNAAARRDAMVSAGFWRDKTLLDYFERHVETTPAKIALVARNEDNGPELRYTFQALGKRAESLAIGLKREGIEPGDVVSFQLPNWLDFTTLHLACLKIGAITNPLMVIFRERELKFMLGLGESRILVVPARFRNYQHYSNAVAVQKHLPSLRKIYVVGGEGDENFDNLIVSDASQEERRWVRRYRLPADAVIQLLYTSGTTGKPKGVCHTSNTMLSNLVPFSERLRLNGDDVIHMPSPMSHQLGFMYGLVMPAMLGATAILQDIFDARAMARQITDNGVTFTMGATPFLNDLADYCQASGKQTHSLRIFVSAGAPIPRSLVTKAHDVLGAAVLSAWGMTENGAVTTTRPDDPSHKVTETDGCPLPGMGVRVLDSDGSVKASDEEGDLQVRGCSNFVGYMKRSDLSRTDPEGWFDTGDIARMDSDGYIRITGRSKDIIIRGGENIPVVEVEELLFKHPSIAIASIVGFPDSRLGERACAFVVLKPGESLTFGQMTDYLRERNLALQYIPERLEIVEAMPTTPSGKIQKFKLREMAKDFTTS